MSADTRPGKGGERKATSERKPADRRPSWKEGRETTRPSARRGGLDTPLASSSRRTLRGPTFDTETFGRWSEGFARFMGTAWFIIGMTVFVAVWLGWNTLAPVSMQFDPRSLNYTLLTLILSLQASYAAPLILLAQNRQADRDRVGAEQDRDRAERALADTEYLAREIAALRIALGEVATRDFVRSELRALIDETTLTKRSKKTKGKPASDAFESAPAVKPSTPTTNGSTSDANARRPGGSTPDPSSNGSTLNTEVPTETG